MTPAADEADQAMSKLSQAISQKLPRRRRRFWRYVSRRRRGAGVVVLALLLAAVYGYWYQTNDRRIRRKAETYLRDLTGGRVKIHRARFRFFGGIELERVRLYLPNDRAPGPFFRAEKVLMRHRPWELLVAGRIKPTEIICIEPTVTLEYETRLGAYRLGELFRPGRRGDSPAALNWRELLVPIRVRSGKLAIVDVEGDLRQAVGELPVEMSMARRGEDNYVITFEKSGPAGSETMQGEIVIDLKTGKIVQGSGLVALKTLDEALPRRYRRWRQRYELTGDVRLKRTTNTEASGGILEAQLEDVSMKLPVEQGGLQVLHVRGLLRFEVGGVRLEGISGRLPQAGDARLEMSGRYEGYEPTSPYRVNLKIRGMTMPDGGGITGRLAEALEDIRRLYRPEGRMDVSVDFSRNQDGKVSYSGTAEPQGMSLLFKHFPYRIENVHGKIAFQPGRIELAGLTARRGEGRFDIAGRVNLTAGRRTFNVTVKVADGTFDEELFSAIPERYRSFYEAVSPRGRASAEVRVRRGAQDASERVDVHLKMTGQGSIEYVKFPYRIEGLTGDVYISPGIVRIESVRGRRGKASCTIDGRIKNPGTAKAEVELTIRGKAVPLDRVLADAVGKTGRAALEALQPNGAAQEFTAKVSKPPDGALNYRVVATLKDVELKLRAFPYRISNTAGVVTILPGRAIFENLRGVHGKTDISASGQVHLGGDGFGLDVQVNATDVPLDKDFREALPANFRGVWDRLEPKGRADMALSLRRNLPEDPGTDYEFVLKPRGMAVRCREFPYPFRGITGRIVATPGKVSLEKLMARSGSMTGTLQGVFFTDRDSRRAELTVTGAHIPIDAELLKALPEEFAPLAARFAPGGTCDVNFKKLRIVRPGVAAGLEGPGAQGSKTPPLASWEVTGSVAVHEAAVNLGFGKKTITGKVEGAAARDAKGLALDARVALDSIVMGEYRVTDLRGELVKSPGSSMLRLEKLSAKAHGGMLAGFAQIELRRPLRYGINLTVDRIRLKELFFPEGGQPAGSRPKVTGLLDGRIELMETSGKVATRQAAGALRVSGARLYKLPVLLDLLTVVFLSLPEQAVFQEGEFIYHLRGQKLVLDEIYLRGKPNPLTGAQLALVGSGTMDMKTKKLNLTFLADPLGRLPRLGGPFEEGLTGILREIMEIEVTGTLTEPKTRTRSLRGLEEAIRKLLNPGRE